MVTCLTIGDPHFKINNSRDTERMEQALLAVVTQHRPTFIVVMGDVLDRFEAIHVSPLTRATKFLYQLSLHARLFLLIGNHDRPNNSVFLTEQHPFNALKHWPNCTVVDTTTAMTIRGRLFVFVPYVYPGRLFEALERTPEWPKADAIFAHQELRGARLGVQTSAVGDVWAPDYPLIISGHIHDYHELQPNAVYVGTPLQHGYGDSADKTVSLFTFPGPEDKVALEHRCLSLGLPRKRIMHMTAAELMQLSLDDGEGLKIIVTGNEAEIRTAARSLQAKQLQEVGVKVVYRETSQLQLTAEKPTVPYALALYHNIERDTELLGLYRELIGELPAPRVTLRLNIKPATQTP